MSNYIGITIGPIYDTLMLSSTPASLWGASYLFSHISKSICEKLISRGISKPSFVTPYIDDQEGGILSVEINKSFQEGIGLFHDRIIIESEKVESVTEVISEIKEEVALGFSESIGNEEKVKKYFDQYLQLQFVLLQVGENENPILKLSPHLDAIELQKTYVVHEESNYILELFANKSDKNIQGINSNKLIKESFLVNNLKKWQLLNGKDNILDIESIAGKQQDIKTYKKDSYYAIVQADGDNMGKVLSQLTTKEEIRQFSKNCLSFGAESSKLIKEFGGITMFAGGDDLLFLAPVNGYGDEKLIILLKKIQDVFNNVFASYIEMMKLEQNPIPSVSFGLVIRYYKYPLYEAFSAASSELFGHAKYSPGKNAVSINVQKHSGQSIEFIIEDFNNNSRVEDILQLEAYNKSDFLKSIRQKLMSHNVLFSLAKSNQSLKSVFENIFDEDIHKKEANITYLNKIKEFYKNMDKVQVNKPIEEIEDKSLSALISVLSYAKFLSDKGSEVDE